VTASGTTRIFADASLDDTLRDEGVVTTPFLTSEELDSLRARLPSIEAHEFRTTMHDPRIEHRAEIERVLASVVDVAIERLLVGYRVVTRQLAVKPPQRDAGVVGPHQDWSVVDDEHRHVPVVVWFALEDVTPEGGALWVVPRSHRLATCPRPNAAPEDYFSPLTPIVPLLRERFARCVPVRAGDAIVYHPGLVHYSGVASGDTPRVAVIVACAPVRAPLRHFFRRPDGLVDVYATDDDFYVRRARVGAPPLDATPIATVAEARDLLAEADVVRAGLDGRA
jgi:hypothetical protein